MGVPPIRLRDELDEEVLAEVGEVLTSGMWIDNLKVRALEEEFARFTGTKFCRAVSNGTAALLCALYAIDLQPGDEVIVPSFSFIATANVVKHFKAVPVFVDIDETFNIDPGVIEEKITSRTRAVMPVHLFGLPAEMDEINEVARKHELSVVEDSCQAHGAEYRGRKTGSLGDIAAFSLYPTKNMYCGGEGGLVTTDDEELFERVKLFANHGRSARYQHAAEGYNYRMQEVNAVVARYSLSKLPEHNDRRRRWASMYDEAFESLQGVETPVEPAHCRHVYHQYTLRVDDRDGLKEKLSRKEIAYGVYYETPIHKQKYYLDQGVDASLPFTERAASQVISLPVHHNISEEEINSVIACVMSQD
ncbi:MAG: DegT/DnrJ/EryC1/StrS family aminotransferase [Promethearchaeota archaeon]